MLARNLNVKACIFKIRVFLTPLTLNHCGIYYKRAIKASSVNNEVYYLEATFSSRDAVYVIKLKAGVPKFHLVLQILHFLAAAMFTFLRFFVLFWRGCHLAN